MEARIEKLEEFVVEARDRLTKIETRLDQTATKADLTGLEARMHKGFAEMIRWVVGSAFVLGATAITVITFVLNYATPPRNLPVPAVQPAPIVIQLLPYPAPAPRQ
jgi:hypothetical protein